MVETLVLAWSALTGLFRSRGRLEAEILVLRQQINVLRRKSPKRFAFGIFDRWVFVVPTASFRLLYGFLVLRHCRRRFMWLGVTANPTAEWIAQHLTEACG